MAVLHRNTTYMKNNQGKGLLPESPAATSMGWGVLVLIIQLNCNGCKNPVCATFFAQIPNRIAACHGEAHS